MEEKQRIIKAETQEQKKHMRAHAQELKAELQKSSADDIINPEIYGYLSIKQAGQLPDGMEVEDDFKVDSIVDALRLSFCPEVIINGNRPKKKSKNLHCIKVLKH